MIGVNVDTVNAVFEAVDFLFVDSKVFCCCCLKCCCVFTALAVIAAAGIDGQKALRQKPARRDGT